MKSDKGYVPINRFEIQESNLYPHGKKFSEFEAFFDLLISAAHSETSFKARGIKVKLKRGQVGYSFVTLATRWNWDRKTVRKFIQETLKKEENVDSKNYPEKNPVTTIITINSYDHYVRNFENMDTKRDTKRDSKTDIERDTFNNYENYENYKKNDNEYDIPENPGCDDDSTSNNFNRKLSEKETDLIDNFLSWAYNPENNFKLKKSIEETREQIENTIRKYGYEDIEYYFSQCSEERLPWDNLEDQKSAYSEFWESVKLHKDKKEFEKIKESQAAIIPMVNSILGTKFDTRGCRNFEKLLRNNAGNNDIVLFIKWFKGNGFTESRSFNDIFSKENWDGFLKKKEKRNNVN